MNEYIGIDIGGNEDSHRSVRRGRKYPRKEKIRDENEGRNLKRDL